MREHGVGMTEGKQRTDPTAFSPLTCDFHREFQACVKHLAATPLHPRTNAVEYRRGHACLSRTDGRLGETNGKRHIHLTPPPAPAGPCRSIELTNALMTPMPARIPFATANRPSSQRTLTAATVMTATISSAC